MKHKGLLVVVITGAVCLSRMSHGEDSFSAQQKIGQNLAEVQNNLGNAYYTGKGVPQDFKEAAKWYRLAAEQGFADAQYNMGVFCANGNGVPQDYAEAMRWYRLAAEQGIAFAQFNLGSAYYKGEGVPQDYVEAIKWYRLAAEQGVAKAQALLGNAYYTGNGAPKDYPQAYAWLNLVEAQGNEIAAIAAKGRALIIKEMTPEQIAEGKRLTEEYTKKYLKPTRPSSP